jgi:ribose transport system substrate-binding protein
MKRALLPLLLIPFLALALGLAACGGGDEGAAEPAPPAEPAEHAPVEPAPPAETAATAETGASELNTEDVGPTQDVIPEGDTVEVAFFTVAGNTYLQSSLAAMEEVAAAHNANVTTFDNGFDPAKQFAQIQDATASGNFDAFIVTAIDSAGIVPAVEDALAAGITVVATDTPIGPDYTTTDIQVDGVSGSILRPASLIGEDYREMFLQLCEGKDPCVAVWIPGVRGTVFDQALEDELTAVSEENPSIELIIGPDGGYLAEPAFTAMQDILQANPQIDIVATSDQMAQGAEQAIEDAGRTGEMVIIGGGASKPAVTAVTEDRWYATPTFVPFDEGREAMEMAIIAARGGTIDTPARFSLDYTTVPQVLTQDNKSEWEGFEGQWEG